MKKKKRKKKKKKKWSYHEKKNVKAFRHAKIIHYNFGANFSEIIFVPLQKQMSRFKKKKKKKKKNCKNKITILWLEHCIDQ